MFCAAFGFKNNSIVFGFSPFNVFGFSPFNVFGFSPFRVFGFSPTTSYTPSPYCIDEDTPVLTKNGYVLAKDIKIGDILLTKTFEGIPITNHNNLKDWSFDIIEDFKTVESEVKSIKITDVSETIIINNDNFKRFSTQEDMLVIRDNKLIFVVSSELKSGDKIIKDIDESTTPYCNVETIEIIKEERKVYDFTREPFGLVVADSLFVYGAYPVD